MEKEGEVTLRLCMKEDYFSKKVEFKAWRGG
jgi:hypothetical protein